MRKIRIFPALLLVIAATPALALSDRPYLTADEADLVDLLPPPPAADSPEQKQDIEFSERIQAQRTPEMVARVEADSVFSIFRFADVLGPNFAAAKVPDVEAFFRKVGRDTGLPVTQVKDCWQRPRPFVVDSQIHPPGTMAEDERNKAGTKNTAPHGPGSPCLPPGLAHEYSYSYPSSHSTFGAMTAILLADMVPEKRRELFARGWEFGHNRVVAGLHFETDVEAARTGASIMVAVMMQNPAFKRDLTEAKAELRHALGLVPLTAKAGD